MGAVALLWLLGCQDYALERHQPLLTVTPGELFFEGVPYGDAISAQAQLSNSGNAPAQIQGIRTDGPFEVESYQGELAAGAAREIAVPYTAQSLDAQAGELQVLSTDGDASQLTVALAATTTRPALQVEPSSLAFPISGHEEQGTLTLSNGGDAPLEVLSAALADDGDGAFSLPSSIDGSVIQPQDQLQLTVASQALSAVEGELQIASDDPFQPLVSIPLSTLDCWATILEPQDGALLQAESQHSFEGEIGSMGPIEQLSVSWPSSRDGELGAGSVNSDGDLALETELSAGGHEITLTLEASWGCTATGQVRITVNAPPSATITWPLDEAWRVEGGAFHFVGLAKDANDDAEDLELVWTSDVDGELLRGPPDDGEGYSGFEHEALSPGHHLVTLEVLDPWGETASDSVPVLVLDCSDKHDADGDGYSPATGDCDETDPSVHPGVESDLGDRQSTCYGGEVVELVGENGGDYFAYSIGDPGDIDGDGLPDAIIGARNYPGGALWGGAFLLLGRSTGWDPQISASDLVRIEGSSTTEYLGNNSSAVQDFDGDGLDEVMLFDHQGEGVVTVFLGRTSWSDLLHSDADLNLIGESGAQCSGEDMSAADFDGDGYGDIALGARRWDSSTGSACIVRGGLGRSGDFQLDQADVLFRGESAGDYFGDAVAAAGDVDGDGLADLLISASDHDGVGTDSGAVHLYTQLQGLSGSLSTVDASTTWLGEEAGDGLGAHDMLARAGDVDADGLDDLLFVAAGHDNGELSDAGKVYLYLGASVIAGEQPADLADFSFVGDGGGDLYGSSGESLGPAGDVDGDGLDDFLVGADDDDKAGEGAGRVYLYLGGNSQDWSDEAPLEDADRMFVGVNAGDAAGRAVYAVGDMDDNGIDDFIVGAHGADRAYLHLNEYNRCP